MQTIKKLHFVFFQMIIKFMYGAKEAQVGEFLLD